MAKPPYRPVLVEWLDSMTLSRWSPREEYLKGAHPSTCISVGFLFLKDAERVVILQSLEEEGGDVMAALSIPADCVKRITYLYPKGGR